MVECRPSEEDDVEDIEMPDYELRDRSEGEEQEPMRMESSVMGLWQNTPVIRSGIGTSEEGTDETSCHFGVIRV